jgi:hypothetical protein
MRPRLGGARRAAAMRSRWRPLENWGAVLTAAERTDQNSQEICTIVKPKVGLSMRSRSACNGRARRRSHRQYRKRCRQECSAVCKLSFQQGEMDLNGSFEPSMSLARRCACSFRMKNRGRGRRHEAAVEETDLA